MTTPTPRPDGRQHRNVSRDTDSDLAPLGRLRWAVRAVLILGVAASIAANVLHARPNLISQLIAAWPPLALLLTVELISRVPADRRGLAAGRLFSAAIIAGIAAWVSYWHMVGVAARYGETSAHANYLLPLSVDGLVVVASISLVEIAGRINRSRHAPAGNLIPDAVPIAAANTSGETQLFPADITAQPVTASAVNNAPREDPFRPGRQPSAPRSRDDRQHPADLDAGDGLKTAARRDKPAAAEPPLAGDEPRASAQHPRDGGDTSAAVPGADGGTATDHDGQPLLHHAASGDEPPAAVMKAQANRHNQHADGVPPSRSTGDPSRTRPVEAASDNDADVDPLERKDHAVPSETAAAVAYWYRRDPQLHPADIATKIGRSERTVRRYWPPEPEPVNGDHAHDLADRVLRP